MLIVNVSCLIKLWKMFVYFSFVGKELKLSYSRFGPVHNCVLHFKYNHKNNENMWIFWTYFINEYFAEFDYEKKSVTIYSKEFLYKGKYVKYLNNLQIILTFVTLSILISGILFTLIWLILH